MAEGPAQNIKTTTRTLSLWRYGILVGFVILGLIYARVTPLFENPDESSHLQVIHYFAEHRRLYPPIQPDKRITTATAMAASLRYQEPPQYYTPPLYHALSALLTSHIAMDDLSARLIPSPAWEQGWAPQRNNDPQNKNMYVHLPGETWRESPTMRAAFILRILSIALGCVTVMLTYHIANFVVPDQHTFALGATALVAFNPQFIAISASVTNDPLVIAIFNLFIFLALRAMRDRASWPQWAMLGALIGIGLLTKQSALILLPIGGLAILGQGPPHKLPAWHKIMTDGLAFGLAALLVSGGWYVNNLQYGDVMGLAPHLNSQRQLSSFGLQAILATFETYWAGFGWALRTAPGWIYGILASLVIAATIGILRTILPKGQYYNASTPTQRALGLLAITVGLNMLSLTRWAVATGAPYGRLLFPSITATAVLMAWGLWQGHRVLRAALPATGTLLLIFATLTPWTILRPTFASPHIPEIPPNNTTTINATFKNGPTLLGYQIKNAKYMGEDNQKTLNPGETLRVKLYWQANTTSDILYNTWIQLGPQDPTQQIAQDNVWLGGTLYPSDLWQAGDTIQQIHRLRIPKQNVPFGLYWIRLGLTTQTHTRMPLAGDDNANLQDTVTLGPWRIRPTSSTPPAHPLQYRLGDKILVQGYDVSLHNTLELTLTWQAKSPPSADYTVFVHWLDGEGNIVSQQDAPPAKGHYPTSWWLSGDTIADPHTLKPPANLEDIIYLNIGMYHPQSGERLPAYTPSGVQLPNGIIPLDIPIATP